MGKHLKQENQTVKKLQHFVESQQVTLKFKMAYITLTQNKNFSHKNQVGSKSAKQKTNKGSSTRKTNHISGKGQLAKTKHVDSPHPLKTTTHSITDPDTCDSQSVSTSVQLLNMGKCQQVDNGILCQVREC